MLARLAAFIVWALVAGGVVFWSLKLLVRAPSAPAHSVAMGAAATTRGDLTRLLGAAPAVSVATATLSPAAASRFRLHGVMAPKRPLTAKPSGQGVALISVDGKPPRAYAVGASVDSNLVLQSVSLRHAAIGPADGAASVNLEVPALPAPATGKLVPVAPVPPVPAVPPDGAPPRPALPAMLQTPAAAPATATSMDRAPNIGVPRQPAANSR
jgi:general secretion pathway protein C